MRTTFDDETLRLLAESREVRIATTRPDGTERRTVIWVVLEGGQVFVRSVRGDRGQWFRAALDRPAEVALIVEGRSIPVTAVPAMDEESIARCSAGLQAKYRRSMSLLSMLEPQTLATTIRLDPR